MILAVWPQFHSIQAITSCCDIAVAHDSPPGQSCGAGRHAPTGSAGPAGMSARLQSSPPLLLPHLCALYVHIPTHSHVHSHFYACTLAPSTLPHHPSVPNTSLQHPLFSQSHLNDMASLRRVAAAALCLLALVASASAACTTGESVSLCPFHLAQQRLVADRQLQHAWAHGLTPGLPPPPPPPSRLPPHRLAPAGPGCHQHPQRSPGQVPQQHPGRCHRHVRLLPGHPHPPGRR